MAYCCFHAVLGWANFEDLYDYKYLEEDIYASDPRHKQRTAAFSKVLTKFIHKLYVVVFWFPYAGNCNQNVQKREL